MFHWFSIKQKKNLPDYWIRYKDSFSQKLHENISEVEFVVLDTETTGFDFKSDRILSIGAVKVAGNVIDIANSFEVYIHQDKFDPKSVEIHGLLKDGTVKKLTEQEAIIQFLDYVQNSVIVAHHANFDITMINEVLRRHNLPKLKNKVLDTGALYRATRINTNLIDKQKKHTLDDIANAYDISLKDRHTASGDAYITAIAFIKIISKLNKNNTLKTKNLFRL